MSLVRRMQERRRYRERERRLAELDRTGYAPPPGVMPRQGGRWPRQETLVFVACLLAIVVALGFVASRVLPPLTATSTGAYAFMVTAADGKPVTYDRCRPIHYVVNPTGMPLSGLELVSSAVREISAASKLTFVADGLTSERLAETRELRQPQRYGDRWAPVLIGWADATSYPLLSGDVAGVGGSSVVAPGGPGSERYVTGQVALNRAWFATVMARSGRDADARTVVMHELAHVVGLAHVLDPNEVMVESGIEVTEWGPGDRRGLAAVGAGRCWPDT